MNTTRLRELCNAAEKGALRGEEMRELVTLARELVSRVHCAGELLGLVKPALSKVVHVKRIDPLDERIMAAVRNAPRSSSTELYRAVGGNKSAFITMLQRLNEDGYVEKHCVGTRREYVAVP